MKTYGVDRIIGHEQRVRVVATGGIEVVVARDAHYRWGVCDGPNSVMHYSSRRLSDIIRSVRRRIKSDQYR